MNVSLALQTSQASQASQIAVLLRSVLLQKRDQDKARIHLPSKLFPARTQIRCYVF